MKINKNLFDFLKSTSVVMFTSSLVGLSFILLEKPFWPAFILAVCTQYILFSFVANLINSFLAASVRQKELDVLEPLSSILQCATCSASNVITFVPNQNERVEFVCDSPTCASKNVVNINFTVARVTEFNDPIEIK